MSEIKFGDRMIFATKHLIKSMELSVDNSVSIYKIDWHAVKKVIWSNGVILESSMKTRKAAKDVHIKIAKAAMVVK